MHHCVILHVHGPDTAEDAESEVESWLDELGETAFGADWWALGGRWQEELDARGGRTISADTDEFAKRVAEWLEVRHQNWRNDAAVLAPEGIEGRVFGGARERILELADSPVAPVDAMPVDSSGQISEPDWMLGYRLRRAARYFDEYAHIGVGVYSITEQTSSMGPICETAAEEPAGHWLVAVDLHT